MNELINFFSDEIHSYMRQQTISDGILVDVTDIAKNCGYKIPVAVTETVWDRYIQWNDVDNQIQTLQHQNARARDVLSMLYLACISNQNKSCVHYKLLVIPRDGQSILLSEIQLKGIIGAGDNGKPVITIMLPHED